MREPLHRTVTDPPSVAVQDKDGTGDITAEELGQVMKELGLNPTAEELRDLVSEADLNKDGVISFDGMVAVST